MHRNTSTSGFTEARMRVFQGSRVSLPSREPLLDRLFEETDGSLAGQRITLFVAPNGYGKSSTAAAWLGDGNDSSEPVRWVDCSESQPKNLWQLIAEQIAPFTGSAAEGAGSAGSVPKMESDTDVAHFAKTLQRPVTLVLDNYHYKTTPANDIALTRLSGITPLLNIVIIACRVSVLTGPLAMAKARVRIVGPSDLALSSAEQHELALALGVAQNDCLDEALTLADGWPLAIRAALNIGSDLQHLVAPRALDSGDPLSTDALNPVENLRSFALNYLEVVGPHARRMLLAASLIDAISLAQIQQLTGLEAETALAEIHELIELGLLRAIAAPTGDDYRCHISIKDSLRPVAMRDLTNAERNQLFVGRADEIKPTAPLAAFLLYCRAEEYTAAETTLASNFTTLTNEVDTCREMLRALPESVQREHPTFTAALLFLEIPNLAIAPSTLEYLMALWLQSLQKRLPSDDPTESDPLFLQLICQAMVATRTTGQIETSVSLMNTLESRLTPDRIIDRTTNSASQFGANPNSFFAPTLNGSLPTYYKELAATALAVGDFTRARRSLEALRDHSLRKMATPGTGIGYAAIRTVTDPQAGARWLLAAQSELAYTELLDGDIHACVRLLAEMDEHAERSGQPAPGISWVSAEIARAHLGYELGQPELLAIARERLTPLQTRLESWPLMIMAEVSMIRLQRGADWALAHLRSAIDSTAVHQGHQGRITGIFTSFQATMCTITGNLAAAEELLSQAPHNASFTSLERARLALYSGDNVAALAIALNLRDPETSKRQRLDRSLISAIAAWGNNRPEEAFTDLAIAGEAITSLGLYSRLQSVPYDELVAVTTAAKEAGVCDLTEMVAAVPVPARSVRYKRLTEMELQTLIAINTHRNASQAAASLHVTLGTVKKHLVSVYKKLRVSGRDEAILQASRMGLLKPLV